METFVAHHKSPINEYDYLAVRVGLNAAPVYLIDGRQCYVSGETRVIRARQGRTAYNAIFVRFLDDGSAMRLTGTEFSKRAKNAPLPSPSYDRERSEALANVLGGKPVMADYFDSNI